MSRTGAFAAANALQHTDFFGGAIPFRLRDDRGRFILGLVHVVPTT